MCSVSHKDVSQAGNNHIILLPCHSCLRLWLEDWEKLYISLYLDPGFFFPSCISDLRLLCLSHWKYFYAEKNKRERLKRKTVSVKVSRLKLWGADEILALQPERKAALAKHSALSTKRDPKVELRCCPLWPWALRQRRDEENVSCSLIKKISYVLVEYSFFSEKKKKKGEKKDVQEVLLFAWIILYSGYQNTPQGVPLDDPKILFKL